MLFFHFMASFYHFIKQNETIKRQASGPFFNAYEKYELA